MNEPLSFTNRQVQQLRRLLGRRSSRADERMFVIEGATLIAEAVAAGVHIESEFLAPGAAAVTSESIYHLADGVIERVATTQTPQGNLALAQIDEPAIELDTANLILVADRLGDPGNLGTILRSAEAAGVDAVVVTPGTVDVYSPKTVRASAGALFHVPVVSTSLQTVAAAGFRLIGTSSHLGEDVETFDWGGKVAIVLGNEAHGVDDDAPIAEWVRIVHHGRSESLNVAMAATLLVFAAVRRRR